MNCPNCNAPIPKTLSGKAKARTKELWNQNPRLPKKEIFRMLLQEGHHISYPSVWRILNRMRSAGA